MGLLLITKLRLDTWKVLSFLPETEMTRGRKKTNRNHVAFEEPGRFCGGSATHVFGDAFRDG